MSHAASPTAVPIARDGQPSCVPPPLLVLLCALDQARRSAWASQRARRADKARSDRAESRSQPLVTRRRGLSWRLATGDWHFCPTKDSTGVALSSCRREGEEHPDLLTVGMFKLGVAVELGEQSVESLVPRSTLEEEVKRGVLLLPGAVGVGLHHFADPVRAARFVELGDELARRIPAGVAGQSGVDAVEGQGVGCGRWRELCLVASGPVRGRGRPR